MDYFESLGLKKRNCTSGAGLKREFYKKHDSTYHSVFTLMLWIKK